MSDIATKLTYLNTTKGKIKDAINNIGGNITSETPFRQYVAALESIYQSMPKVSGSGTSLSLSPTLKGLMQIDLKGNTSQVQLSGKNLCGIPNQTTSVRNVSVVVQDGEITLNGTSNGDGILYLQPINTTILNGNYTTNIIYVSGGYTGSNGNFNLRNVDETIIRGSQVNLSTSNSNTSITLNEDTSVIFGIYIGNGNVFTNYKFKPQLVVGTSADYDYQEYVGGTPSPNPSYPQDIHNVSGNNSIVVCGKNLIDISKMLIAGGWTDTTFVPTSTNYITLEYIRVKPSTKYTLSTNLSSSKYSTLRIVDFDINKTIIRRNAGISLSTSNTFTTNNDTYFIAICFYTSQTSSTSDLTQVQLELGETATTYEAYNGTTYPINLPNGMELCKIGTYQDYFYKEDDKWYLHKETGKVVYNGTEEKWVRNRINTSSPWYFYKVKQTEQVAGKVFYTNHFIFGASYGSVDNSCYCGNTNIIFGCVKVNGSYLETIDDWKNWLASNNIIAYYPISTPTNTEITDTTLISQLEAIYNAKSKNGTTNISQTNNDLPFIIDVSALLGSGS